MVVWNSDLIADGSQECSWTLRDGEAVLEFQGRRIRLREVATAWWRKPQWLNIHRADAALRLSIEAEALRTVHALWSLIPEEAWLNAPLKMHAAGHLPIQLLAAHEVGFRTPPTLVTNRWSSATSLGSDFVAFKTLGGGLTEADRNRVMYTQRLRVDEVGGLGANPFPGIVQPFLEKTREWRVTVVDDAAFAASIHTGSETNNDWREHQFSGSVRFMREDIDTELARRCIALTARLGLGHAALDLVETPDGTTVFLEANPNGQYGWLDDQLGLGISGSIAEALARRAHRELQP